jgi:glyoxylase-like metal-dependent hydrolase (beta-lactamase superfamily II)
VGPLELPSRITTWFRNGVLTEVSFPDLTPGWQTPRDAFRSPDTTGAVTIGGSLNITVDSVAPHVFAVHYGQTAGPNFGYNPPFAYAQLVVELKDRLFLMDAPWYPSLQQSALDKLAARFPGKPVGIVSFTHYHSDHFGGLRPYIKPEVTFVTTPGIGRLIQRVARVVHPSDYQAKPLVPRIEIFSDERTIDDPDAPVELHRISSGHADEMVIAYLPRQHLLYTADLFGIFPMRGGPGGSYPAERELAEYVRKQGWKVETVVSGHGSITLRHQLELLLEH